MFHDLFIFTQILLQCLVHAIRSPCNLNASIEKQPTLTLETGIYTPMAVEERSKQHVIWRPNGFMNVCLLGRQYRNICPLVTGKARSVMSPMPLASGDITL